MKPQVWIIDEDRQQAAVCRDALEREGCEVELQPSFGELLPETAPQLIVVGIDADQVERGASVVRQARAAHPNVALYMVVSAEDSIESLIRELASEGVRFEVLRAPLRREELGWVARTELKGEPARRFKLYVAGRGDHAKRSGERVAGVLQRGLRGSYSLEIIDILREPERARLDGVVATPTLISVGTQPRSQIVGVDETKIEQLWDPTDVQW